MTENHGPRTGQVIDELVAVFIPYSRSLAFANNDAGVKISETRRRHHLAGALQQLLLTHR